MTAEILARFESKFEPSGSTEISKAILELRSEVQELRKLRESALLQQKEHQ